MIPTARASTTTMLAFALLLVLMIPSFKANPISNDVTFWEPLEMHLDRVRRQSVTCDPEIIRKMIQNSCEVRRRRRREASQRLPASPDGAASPAEDPAALADEEEDILRRVRSFPTTLIEKCCAETCNERTFAGICP